MQSNLLAAGSIPSYHQLEAIMLGEEYVFDKATLLAIAHKIIAAVNDKPDNDRRYKLRIDQDDGTAVELKDPDDRHLFTHVW